MSEQSPFVGNVAPVEVDPELERLQAQLQEADFLLRAWYTSRDSDSVRRQQLREREYSQATGLLTGLHLAVQRHGHVLTLVVPEGSEPVRTHALVKGAYDFVGETPGKKIEPGSSLALEHSRELTMAHGGRFLRFTYFGEHSRQLRAAEIAEVLGKGGELRLDPIEANEKLETV